MHVQVPLGGPELTVLHPRSVEHPIQLIMRPLGNGFSVTSSGHASLVNKDDLRVDRRTTGNTGTIPLAQGPVLIAHYAVLIDRIYYELIIAKAEPGRDPPEEVSVGLYKGDRKEVFRLEKGTKKEVTLWSALPWGKTTLDEKALLEKCEFEHSSFVMTFGVLIRFAKFMKQERACSTSSVILYSTTTAKLSFRDF